MLKNRDKWTSIAAAVLLVIAAGAIVLWVLPIWLTREPSVGMTNPDKHTAIGAARTGIVAFLVVLGTGGGLAYTAKTYRLSQQGQRADRFAKAIDQLGSAQTSVRIGSVYGLAGTVRDAEGYRQAVVSVLNAHVRDSASLLGSQRLTPRRRWRSHAQTRHLQDVSIQPDVLEAISVLKILVREGRVRRLDFRNTNLSEVDLIDMNLVDARFGGARLRGAKLSNADLRGADLRDADLRDARMGGANLEAARLRYGGLTPTQLKMVKGRELIQFS